MYYFIVAIIVAGSGESPPWLAVRAGLREPVRAYA